MHFLGGGQTMNITKLLNVSHVADPHKEGKNIYYGERMSHINKWYDSPLNVTVFIKTHYWFNDSSSTSRKANNSHDTQGYRLYTYYQGKGPGKYRLCIFLNLMNQIYENPTVRKLYFLCHLRKQNEIPATDVRYRRRSEHQHTRISLCAMRFCYFFQAQNQK